MFCFVKQNTAYELRISDWSSDVCSSDLWNLPDGDAVSAQLRALPLYPCFTDIEVIPLAPHPNFPQFARPAETHEKPARSEERRVGQECVSPCRSRGSPYH